VRRTKYSNLVEEVRNGGGEAFIFSGAHTSGEQLNQLSGIAAILRFPLPEIEDQEFDAGY
jgi:protein pelota